MYGWDQLVVSALQKCTLYIEVSALRELTVWRTDHILTLLLLNPDLSPMLLYNISHRFLVHFFRASCEEKELEAKDEKH